MGTREGDTARSRYERQIIFPPIGEEGQERLRRARVVVVGVGGLGCPAATYLACAGVGHLTLIDSDTVEWSNLNRQILHWEEDVGREKVVSAVSKLRRLNSEVDLKAIRTRVTAENAEELLAEAEVVVDALDNVETRLVINRACHRRGKPLVHGGINGLIGEITTILPGRTPCLECLLPSPPPQPPRRPFPVVGATPGVVAALQVMETLKLLLGFGELLAGRVLYLDGETMKFVTASIRPRPGCPVCGGVQGEAAGTERGSM
ncbi:MAG: HesA/MoeB/ThiF family protein [Clostridia bacterium]|nr:HesA/MoeB/ThiF family protein [Clostridia bacterium]MDH7573258.1 HesA/MoeB/ThiF family protein [Clostridia bacterium]